MDMTLYQINKDFEACLNMAVDTDTGEIKNEALIETLTNIKMALEEKAENIVYVMRKLENREDAIDKEINRLKHLKDLAVNTKEKLKEYLSNNIPRDQKIETNLMTISWRKSKAVEITDLSLVPQEFIKTKIEQNPDKKAIADAIKSGQNVAGAMLVERQNIQIK